MEILVRGGLGFLALLHALPAWVFFNPSMAERLYGTPSESDIGVLIVHRGALFCVVLLAAVWAIFDPAVRGLVLAMLAISMIGFLFVYFQAGMPDGSLRTIALADVIGVLVLAMVFVAYARSTS